MRSIAAILSPISLLLLAFFPLALQLPAEEGGDNFRIGKMGVDLRGNLTHTYDSNIGQSPDNANADWITSVGLLLTGEMVLTEINTLRLSIGAEYRKYWYNPEFDSNKNSLILTPKTSLELLAQAGNFDFRLYDDFSILSDPGDNRFIDPGSGALLTNIVLYNRIRNRLGVDSTWTINPYWNANAGIARVDIFPLDNEFQDLQRHSYVGSLGLSHNVAANLDVNGQVSGTVDRWRTGFQPDSSSWSVGAGADWRPTDLIECQAFLAWTNRRFGYDDTNPTGTLHSAGLTGNLAVTHQLNPELQHSIRYGRSIDLGTASNEVTNQFIEYRVDYSGFERSDIYGEIFWNQGVESGFTGPESFDRWAFRAGLGYPLSQKLEFSIRIEHSFRDSNLAGRNYSRNTAALTLTYDF